MLWEYGYSLGWPGNGCLVYADWNYTFLLLHFIRTNCLQLFIFLKDKWQQSRYDSPLTILMEKLEALPDGQISPSWRRKLGSHHCNLRRLNFSGRLHLKVALRDFSRPKPTWVSGIFKSHDPLLQHNNRTDETNHVGPPRFTTCPLDRPNTSKLIESSFWLRQFSFQAKCRKYLQWARFSPSWTNNVNFFALVDTPGTFRLTICNH